MKKIFFATALTIVVSTVFAAEKDYCSELGRLATTVMELRQQEFPMSKVLESSEDETVRNIIFAAYAQRSYQYEENKKRAVAEFANMVMSECYKKGYDKE